MIDDITPLTWANDIPFTPVDVDRIKRLRAVGCRDPLPLLGWHGTRLRCRLCNREEML